MMYVFKSLLVFVFLFICKNECALEVVNDDDLLNLFRNEKYVVVLFSKYVI